MRSNNGLKDRPTDTHTDVMNVKLKCLHGQRESTDRGTETTGFPFRLCAVTNTLLK